MDETPPAWGEWVRARRRELGLTQGEVARRTGLSLRALRELEQSRVRRPRAGSVRALAEVLGPPGGQPDTRSGAGEPSGVPRLHIGVLGPLVVRRGAELRITSSRTRTLLGLLAIQPGRLVPVAEVVDALWGSNPPPGWQQALHHYVWQLRDLLEPGRARRAPASTVARTGGGYLLDVAPDQVDLGRFDQLAGQAQAAARSGAAQSAMRLWTEALRCWRGPVLADLDGGLRQHPVAVGVAARRFSAAIAYADLAIGLGAHDAAVETLRPVAAAEPLHEGIHARLMLALASAGQRAAALTVFAELRSRLVDELGVEPALTVQRAHREVLRHEAGPSGGPAIQPSGRGPRPAQLPADVAYFTGRTDELAELDGLLRTRNTAVLITAIAGTAAVGKTALAVHFAHRVAHWFSDGQIYVNLRGFEPSDAAMTPSEALRDLLTALGVPPQRIPPTPGAQVGLYRSLLANRRVLIVLDNARDAEQVRPLLPGASGCLALVTSRNQLASLVAVDGARPLAVAPLAPDEAVELLAARLGRRRVDAEPEAARKIVAHCAGLPLALAIVAARAATRPGFQLAALAGELRDAPTALDGLRGAEPVTDIHAVFSWSYRTLSTAAARLFRLLGLHPGPDVTAPAAASLAGLPGATARRLLAELVDASLVTEHLPGRYACHDLLRAYAAERARVVDSPAERDEALRRVVDHYLHTAHAAALAIDSHGDPIGLAPAVPGVTPEHIADDKRALAWFTIEYPVLLGAAGQAADAGLDDRAWRLGWTLARFLHREGRWRDQVVVQHTALDAAVRCSDLTGQAEAHRFVAAAYVGLGRVEDGHAHVRHYLDLADRLGNDVARAYAHFCLAVVALMQNRAADAVRYSRRALELFRATGQLPGQAYALNGLAECCIMAGDYREAIVHCGQALAIQQELGDRWAQAGTWINLGDAHHHLGDHGAATACFGKAVELLRQTGGRYYSADALARLGDTHAAAGDPDAARDAWLQALEILTELGTPEVDDIRAKLTAARQA